MERGYFVADPADADILIVNTCSVTALADKKSRQAIRAAMSKNPSIKLVITGCGAGAKISGASSPILTLNNKEKSNLIDRLESIGIIKMRNTAHSVAVSKKRTRALLKVQDGCNNFCTYCIVPYLRGREVSIPYGQIISEAKKLDDLGYKEIVISGVNVGKYGLGLNDKSGHKTLEDVLSGILKETGFMRIRLSSVNPQDITDGLTLLWAKEPRLARHFHLSLQSGSTAVLKRMGRPYTAQEYYSKITKIRSMVPDMAFTTDVIVGFPGETDKEYKETLEFVNKIGFAKVHVFRYSDREGTKASKMHDKVSEDIKRLRAERLTKLTDKLHTKFVQEHIGQKTGVIFESEKGNFWVGLTSDYAKVKARSKKDLFNQYLEVTPSKVEKDGYLIANI
jgi:threonylcarbamoyladenosine tRNA methylthiotransferase MtaB